MWDTDKYKRRFQCFVCAVQFDEFEEYSKHIIENHEEGQDYVKCPLTRCQAPVRCVRTHFKAKHPSEKLPQVGQLKATIWRDISPQGKIKKRRPKFREGWHQSTKMGKNFYYRSGYEKTVYELLDSWHNCTAYEVEPFAIPYIHQGEQHDYTPDVLVSYLNGFMEVWEIKPANQTLLEKNQDKWFAAQRACEARCWGFKVMTESSINKLKKTVKEQYLNES